MLILYRVKMFSVSLEQIKECSREQLDKKKKWKSIGVDCGNSEINFLGRLYAQNIN